MPSFGPREFLATPTPRKASARWEATGRMQFLCALAWGERIAVAAGEYLVVTSRGDPMRGCLIEDADLAALQRRGWVRMAGDAETAVATYHGKRAAREWFRRTYGGDFRRCFVVDEVTPLLAAKKGVA